MGLVLSNLHTPSWHQYFKSRQQCVHSDFQYYFIFQTGQRIPKILVLHGYIFERVTKHCRVFSLLKSKSGFLLGFFTNCQRDTLNYSIRQYRHLKSKDLPQTNENGSRYTDEPTSMTLQGKERQIRSIESAHWFSFHFYWRRWKCYDVTTVFKAKCYVYTDKTTKFSYSTDYWPLS